MVRFCRFIYCILPVIGLFYSCQRLHEPDNPIIFEACTPMPESRAAATAFAVGDRAYIVGGRTIDSDACKQHPEGYPKNMWMYDAATDAWTDLGEVPFGCRVNATAITVDGEVYVGLGFRGYIYTDNCYLRDWWRYNPATAERERLADFPNEYTNANVAYCADGKIYLCYGFGTYGYSRQICRYDIQTDTWAVYADNHKRVPAAISVMGGQVGDRCFLGSGFNTDRLNIRYWYEFDPATDTWHERAKLPAGRIFATTIAGSNSLFVLGGRHFGGTLTTGQLYDDVLEYDLDADRWLLRGHLPEGARENAVAFEIGGCKYIGLGENSEGKILNDLHRWHD